MQLLSCTTVKVPTESYKDWLARFNAKLEAESTIKKQKKEAFIQPISDPRFNGIFYEKDKEYYEECKWMFDGTNNAFYHNGWYSYVESTWYHYEIRIENGVLYHAFWPISGYREETDVVTWLTDGKYSFTDDGALVLTKETKTREGKPFTYTKVFLRDRSKD